MLSSRTKYDLANYFSRIPKSTRNQVTHIAMDMWQTYRDVTQVYFPKAKICVDSFHVISMISRAFQSVRVRVMNSFERGSDEYYLIKSFLGYWIKTFITHVKWDIYVFIKHFPFKVSTPYSCCWTFKFRFILDPELEIAYLLKYEYEQINSKCTDKTIEIRLEKYIEDLAIFNLREFETVKKHLRTGNTNEILFYWIWEFWAIQKMSALFFKWSFNNQRLTHINSVVSHKKKTLSHDYTRIESSYLSNSLHMANHNFRSNQ